MSENSTDNLVNLTKLRSLLEQRYKQAKEILEADFSFPSSLPWFFDNKIRQNLKILATPDYGYSIKEKETFNRYFNDIVKSSDPEKILKALISVELDLAKAGWLLSQDELPGHYQRFRANEWKYEVVMVQPGLDCGVAVKRQSTNALLLICFEWLYNMDSSLLIMGH